MIVGKHHVTFNEIEYNREKLVRFYEKFKECIMPFGDYMQWLTPSKREFKGRVGMNAVNTELLEGKKLREYDEIEDLVKLFNFDVPLAMDDIDLLHYDPGFTFHPHTDHFMHCGIMFPVLPADGDAPIIFYEKDGLEVVPRKNYTDLVTEEDIVYKHYYSTKHPTMFNGHTIHSVGTTSTERVYLRLKILHQTFHSVIEKNQQNKLIFTGKNT